jgi:hypothetical protein
VITRDFVALLHEQRLNRFREIAGADAVFTLPVSDRLVTRLVTENLPDDGPVRELDLEAQTGNLVLVRVKLTRPAFLPSVSLRLFIERQPALPASPVIGLRMEMAAGLTGLAGPALKMMGSLPRGLQLEGDRLEVDLRALLERANAMDVLDYLGELQLTTEQGRFVIAGRISIQERGASAPRQGL